MDSPPDMEELSDLLDSDDYYSWLSLNNEATREDIKKAYQKYSRIYHPDKHTNNPVLLDKSKFMFDHIRKAYDILSDDHKRAIYDTMGVKGLETDGWELVSRTKTPAEIIDEYDRMKKEREERRLQQRTNPKGTVRVGVDLTDIFDQYESEENLDYGSSWPRIEISQMSISQSVECPLTATDTASLSGALQSENGRGNGHINASLRRILSSKSWAEVELSVGGDTMLHLRGFRSLWKRTYCTMGGVVQFTPRGIRPGCSATLASQLDTNIQGRVSWSAGTSSNVSTTLIYETERHHLSTALQIGVHTSFAMLSYVFKFPSYDTKVKTALRFGTFGVLFEYGCEKKVSSFSHLGATITVGPPIGVSLRIKLLRGSQSYEFPLHLSENVDMSALFYGTAIPVVAYLVAKVFFVNPYLRGQEMRELQRKKEVNKQRIEEKKREAISALDLMKSSIERSYEKEKSICGLVVVKALFGKLQTDSIRHEESHDYKDNEYIHVTRQLQHQVESSRLVLEQGTEMSGLPGFYDPCIGEDKQLSIEYKFRNKPHKCIFKNKDKIRIPQPSHEMKEETEAAVTAEDGDYGVPAPAT